MTPDSPEQPASERHPDIEIYLKAQPVPQVEAWLQDRFGPLTAVAKNKQGCRYRLEIDGRTVPVMVIEKAAGNFTSVWFDSDRTPWARDIDCAREAHRHFQCETRCVASGWTDGDEPDEWWSITEAGEGKILWRS